MIDFNPDDYGVSELSPTIRDTDDLGESEEILQAEHHGQSRVPTVASIESRIEKLSEDEEPTDADGLDLASMSTAEVENIPQSAEEVLEFESLLEREEVSKNRDPTKRLIRNHIDSVKGSSEEDTEVKVDDRAPGKRHPDPDHPAHDKRHVRPLYGGTCHDMWAYYETQADELVDVSKEILGKACELMGTYNDDYTTDERVVTVLIDTDVSEHVEDVITYGTDMTIVCENARLERFQHRPCTEILCDMARAGATYQNFKVTNGHDEPWRGCDRPRYVLFPVMNNGRNLSAFVQTELDSGLTSDCSGPYVAEEVISDLVRTGIAGERREFQRVPHMKYPDFSGFGYSTIPCIDNPTREFRPQGASTIPRSFDLFEPDAEREGLVIGHDAPLDNDWFRVTVTTYGRLDEGIDLTGHEVIVTIGHGMGDDPTKGIGLALDLVDQFEDAEVGVTRGIVTGSSNPDDRVE